MDGRLKIQYSDRLVSLLREVRQLSALGFPIPAKIQQAANTADKFYRQAIVLKQVSAWVRHTNEDTKHNGEDTRYVGAKVECQ